MESIVIHQPDRLAIEQREIPVPAKGGRGAHCADGILQRTLSDYAAGHSRKRTVPFSSRLNARKFPTVIAWMAQGLIDPEKLITHQFDYHRVTDALDIFEKDQRKCCKVLITFTA